MKLVAPTPEQVKNWTVEQLKTVRDRAQKLGEEATVTLCQEELVRRKPSRVVTSNPSHKGEVVIGFHFVCPNERGVARNKDGTLWTRTWVVAKEHAERAPQIGSYVALHANRATASYLQGIIKTVQRSPRDSSYTEGQEVQTEFGYDFLFEPTDTPYQWVGNATGEKGYAWAPATPV